MWFRFPAIDHLKLFRLIMTCIAGVYILRARDFLSLDLAWSRYDGDDFLLMTSLVLMSLPRPAAVAGLRIQLVMIYLLSGVSKLFVAQWISGQAIEYALLNPAYSLWGFSSLLAIPEISFCLRMATYMVLIFELSFPLLIFTKRLRPYTIAFGLAFHAVTLVTMDLRGFPLMMMAYYLLW